MNIVCIASDPKIDEHLEPLKKVGNLRVFHEQNLSEKETVSLAKDADVLITGPEAVGNLSSPLLRRLPRLKFIALLTIGYNWIDVEYAKRVNLPISTIKGVTAESVAEHIWGMILDLAKRINEFDRDARLNGAYDFSLYKGKEVFGKTLGVIGLGDIGQKVVRIAHAFDMNIIGINKSGKRFDQVGLVDLPTLLRQSDVITVCVPLNKDTENLIGRKEIALMKPGVIVVNCAREEIVNKEAVLEGIKSGKVFGYGVETQIMKPIEKNDPYYKYTNIIVDPHNAFNTIEGDIKTYNAVIENIKSFIEGKPKNLVLI